MFAISSRGGHRAKWKECGVALAQAVEGIKIVPRFPRKILCFYKENFAFFSKMSTVCGPSATSNFAAVSFFSDVSLGFRRAPLFTKTPFLRDFRVFRQTFIFLPQLSYHPASIPAFCRRSKAPLVPRPRGPYPGPGERARSRGPYPAPGTPKFWGPPNGGGQKNASHLFSVRTEKTRIEKWSTARFSQFPPLIPL